MGALGEPWLSADAVVGRRGLLGGKLGWDLCPFGRHFNTASSEARQGWICNGMLNVTRMTMAALPMVEAVFAGSVIPIVQLQSTRVHKINWKIGKHTHGDDIANHIAAEGQISSNGDQNVDGRCRADAGADHPDDASGVSAR